MGGAGPLRWRRWSGSDAARSAFLGSPWRRSWWSPSRRPVHPLPGRSIPDPTLVAVPASQRGAPGPPPPTRSFLTGPVAVAAEYAI